MLIQRITNLQNQNNQLLTQLNQRNAQTFGRVEGASDYRNFKGLQMQDVADEAETPPVKTTKASSTYIVKKGDTLSSIAKKVYGNSSQWRKLLAQNPNSLAKAGNVKTLKVGFELVVR